MPQGVYIENPDDGTKRIKPLADCSINVNVTNPQSSVSVSNLPGTQAVSGTVAVSNFPPNSGETPPPSGDILRASRTTTGTLITVPSGRVWKGSVEVSCSIAVAGTSIPNITDGTNIILQCEASGLALTTVTNASSMGGVYIAGPATISFTAGASGISSGSAAGRLL